MGAVQAEEPEVFGKFLNVKEKVTIKKQDADDRVQVKRGDLIHYGDVVWTGENSRATIVTKDKKIVNLQPDSELNTKTDQAGNKLASKLGMNAMFKSSSTEDLMAVAGVRADTEYVLSPRNSVIKTTTPIIRLKEPAEGSKYRIKITGGGLPSPFKGVVDGHILDVSKADLRKPLKRGTVYFIEAELIGPTRGVEKNVAIYPLEKDDLEVIQDIEKEIAELQKADPDNPSYRLLLASEYEDMELYSDALAVYKQLHQKYPEDEYIRNQLARMYDQTGLVTALKKLLER